MENGNGHISKRGIEHAVEHFSKTVDLARAERSPTFFMPALKYLSASSIALEPLRCASFVVVNLRWDSHPQECAHAGRPMKRGRLASPFAALGLGLAQPPPPCSPSVILFVT